MQIFPQLTTTQAALLRDLEKACFLHDHVSPPIHWDLIVEPRPIPLNFFYPSPDQKQWWSYLSAFLFKEKEIELSGFTHPLYRGQHLFGFLLAHALRNIAAGSWEYLTSRIPHQLKSGRECFRYLGAQTAISEYEMDFNIANLPYFSNLNNNFTVHTCTPKDFLTLAQLDEKIFGSDVNIMIERYKVILLDPQRYAWVIRVENETAGKLHIKKKSTYGLIHDFGIIPKYQQKKLGLSFLYQLLKSFSQNHNIDHFKLQVVANNEAALKLYEKLGFNITQIYEVWKLKKALVEPYILKTFYNK